MTREQQVLNTFSLRSPVTMMIVVFLGIMLETRYGESWGISGLLAALVGSCGIAYTVWCWLGRSPQARSWALLRYGPDLAILGVPFFAFGFFGAGLYLFFGLPRVVALLFLAVSGVIFLVWIAGFGDCPRWWGPRWFRRKEYGDDVMHGATEQELDQGT